MVPCRAALAGDAAPRATACAAPAGGGDPAGAAAEMVNVCACAKGALSREAVCASRAGRALTWCAGQGSSRVAVKVGGQWSAKPGEAAKDVNAPMFQYEGSAITAVSPNVAPTSGGTVLTLYGNDFADVSSAASSVPLEIKIITPAAQLAKGTLSGGSGQGKDAEKKCESVAWISATAVTCTVPSGVGAALDVEVLLGQPKELYRGFGLFSYAAPVVASVVPSIGNSAGGLAVTVTGSNFGVGDYDPTVLVGATACSRTLYVSDAKLVCVTPPGGGADVGVSVSVAHQQGQVLPSAFGYASPTILRIYPDSGPITGNTHVTITGTNFGRSAASMPKVVPSPPQSLFLSLPLSPPPRNLFLPVSHTPLSPFLLACYPQRLL